MFSTLNPFFSPGSNRSVRVIVPGVGLASRPVHGPAEHPKFLLRTIETGAEDPKVSVYLTHHRHGRRDEVEPHPLVAQGMDRLPLRNPGTDELDKPPGPPLHIPPHETDVLDWTLEGQALDLVLVLPVELGRRSGEQGSVRTTPPGRSATGFPWRCFFLLPTTGPGVSS